MMNKVILTGRLIKNIELKQTKNGNDYTRFTLAVTRDVKNQLGEYETDFINCISYGAVCRLLSEYTQKGDKIGVEGRIVTSSYEKDGKKTYTTEIAIEKLEFLTPKKTNAEKENKEIEEKISDPFTEFSKETEDLELPF